MLEEHGQQYLELIQADSAKQSAAVGSLMPRVIDRLLGGRHPEPIAALVAMLTAEANSDPVLLQKCLAALTGKLENHEIAADRLAQLRPRLDPLVGKILAGPTDDALFPDAAFLAATWRDPRALDAVRAYFSAADQPAARRARALSALVAAADPTLEKSVAELLADEQGSPVELRAAALGSMARLESPWVAQVVLANYGRLEPELRPKAIELLTERRIWAEQLLDAIGRQEIPAAALNANQVRQLLVGGDDSLAEKVKARWGSVRGDRDPKREEVIAQMRTFLRRTPGDARTGQEVYKRLCGQCHKIYGEGHDVGPDITLNGRNSFEQLLSNVFDPSLVIGASYQARTVVTTDGRVLTGLVAEESPERIVLKTQGGKLETVAGADVEETTTSRLSLMPEELEKQLKPQELADLFAFLTLDKPPGDPSARQLPGTRTVEPRETSDPAKFAELVGQIAPGFTTAKAGKGGVAIVAEQAGREGVLRTRPVSRQEPCVLRGTFDVPQGKRTRLVLSVSHEAGGGWNLAVRANGKGLHQSLVGGADDAQPSWRTISLDLSGLAGTTAKIELVGGSRDGRRDAAYWGQVEIVSD